jgi:hypothetical protein
MFEIVRRHLHHKERGRASIRDDDADRDCQRIGAAEEHNRQDAGEELHHAEESGVLYGDKQFRCQQCQHDRQNEIEQSRSASGCAAFAPAHDRTVCASPAGPVARLVPASASRPASKAPAAPPPHPAWQQLHGHRHDDAVRRVQMRMCPPLVISDDHQEQEREHHHVKRHEHLRAADGLLGLCRRVIRCGRGSLRTGTRCAARSHRSRLQASSRLRHHHIFHRHYGPGA